MKLKKTMSLAAAGVAVLGTVVATAPTAQAATSKNGVCETGEFCLYYNSNHGGSMVDPAAGSRTTAPGRAA